MHYQEFIDAATGALQESGEPVTVDAVLSEAFSAWVEWRDLVIESWAERALEHVPATHLAHIAPRVVDELIALRHWHELPDSPEEWIVAAAWGVACLRWLHREARGLEPVLDTAAADVRQAAEQAVAGHRAVKDWGPLFAPLYAEVAT